MAPARAILPGIDGAQFAVTVARSWDREAMVILLAWGQQEAFDEEHISLPPRSWQAIDNTGRWHIGRLHRERQPNRPQRFLALWPPLHPQTTLLTLILIGGERQGQVTLPLNWQSPRRRPGRTQQTPD